MAKQKHSSERNPRLLYFLRSICKMNNEGISLNQEKIGEALFGNSETYDKVVITTITGSDQKTLNLMLRPDDGVGQVEVELDSCFDEGLLVRFQHEMTYFAELLTLFADITANRNYICRESVQKWFPISTLQHNMWNENISPEFRAGFSRLITTLYLDSYPREERKVPELCRILQHSDQLADINSKAFLRTHRIKDDDQKEAAEEILDEDFVVPIGPDTEVIHQLKQDLLQYFSAQLLQDYSDPLTPKANFDSMTFELVTIAWQMVKFGLFGSACSYLADGKCVLSPKSPRFRYKDMDLARVLEVLSKILLSEDSHQIRVTAARAQHKKSSLWRRKRAKASSILDVVTNNPSALADPIVRYSVNIRNYIDSVLSQVDTTADFNSYEVRTKLELCKIFNYALDCRVNFLVTNVVSWFVNSVGETVGREDILRLFPPIIRVATLDKAKNDFRLHYEPEIQDLDSITDSQGSLMQAFLQAFLTTTHYELQAEYLRLLLRSFNQRVEMLSHLDNLHILSDESDIQMFHWAKEQLVNLRHYVEQTEVWVKYWANASKETNLAKVQGVLALLDQFEIALFQESQLVNGKPASPGKKVVKSERQLMMFHLSIHSLVVTMLKDGMHTLGEMIEAHSKPGMQEAINIITRVFTKAHSFLTNFAKSNSKNQKVLTVHLQTFSFYLRINVGQEQLLSALYADNYDLCMAVKDDLLFEFANLIVSHGRQPRFLMLFNSIQICKGKPIAENQRKVLNILLNSQHKNYFLYLKPDNLDEFLFEKQAPHLGASIYYEDHPVWYHIALLKVFVNCCYGDKGVYLNEAKCQKAVTISMVMTLLEKLEDEKTPLFKYIKAIHQPMLEFLYHIFLNTERVTEELVSHPMFLRYLKLQQAKLTALDSVPARSVKFYEWLLRIVAAFTELFSKTLLKTESTMVEHEDFFVLKSFAMVFSEKIGKFEAVEFSMDAKHDILQLCKIFEINGENLQFGAQKRESTLLQSTISAKQRWDLLANELIYNSDMKEVLFTEKQHLLDLLVGSHSTTELQTRDRVLQALVTFLQHSKAHNVPVQTSLQVLEIFQTLLAPRLKVVEEVKLAELQGELHGYGLVKVALVLLSEQRNNAKLFRALVRLCIYLLWGGNEKIQGEFHNYFLNVQASEHFFARVEYYVEKQVRIVATDVLPSTAKRNCYEEPPDYLRFIMRLLQLLCENHNKPLQNYIRHQTNSRKSYNMIRLTVTLLGALGKKMYFRHFHLMSQCFDTLTESIQGPCLENQTAIIDSGFLDVAVSLLSYSERSNLLEHFPSLKSDEGHSLTLDEERLNDEHQTTYLHGWMISHLKHKCMITLHSLLEGRTDSTVVTPMIRKLHLELLRTNLLSYYENYESRNKPGHYFKDLFGHDENNEDYDFERQNNPQDLDPQNYQIIIECPFLIYHLIRKFRDLDSTKNKESFQEDLPDVELEDSSSKLFGLKIFGDVGKMSVSLFHKGLRAVSTLANSVGDGLDPDKEEELMKKKRETVYRFFEMYTGHVEVVFNEAICKVYFPLPYFYLGFTPEAKQRFDREVDRSSSKAKLNYLQTNVPEMIRGMEHEDRLNRFFSKHVVLAWLASKPEFWEELAFIMSLIINIAILFSYSVYGTDRVNNYSLFYRESSSKGVGLDTRQTIWFFRVCGIVHCVSAGIIVSFFIMKEWPILASKGWRSVADLDDQPHSRLSRTVHKCKRLLAVCYYLLTSFQVLFYLLFIIFSVLGQVINPLFFAFHMLDVSKRYPVLQNIIKSITAPRKTLILTFIFVLMIIYMFAIAGYAFLGDDYGNNGLSLWLTFITSFDRTWKNTGGVGAYLGPQTEGEVRVFRLIYDNLFNIAVMILWLNIVSTIIMDTFTTLREQDESDSADRENKCFICSEHRDIIERLTDKNLRKHMAYEHNVWNYIYFLAYIDKKEQTEYTGIESYVKHCYDHSDISWFPQYQALSFQGQEKDAQKKTLENLKEVEEAVELIERESNEVKHKLGTVKTEIEEESDEASNPDFQEDSEDDSSPSP